MPYIKGVSLDDPPTKYRAERIISILHKLLPNPAHKPDFFDEKLSISIYYALFLPFPILREPEKKDQKELTKYALLSALLSSNQLRNVKRYTVADSTTSTVVSAVLMETIAEELRRLNQHQGGDAKADEQMQAPSAGQSNEELNNIVDKALESVQDVARQAKEISSLAMKFAAGNASMLSLDDVIQDVINLAKNTNVKAIFEVLKLVEDEANMYIRLKKVPSPRGELEGYELGNDVEKIVPSELALPKELFLIKFAERNLLLYRKVVTRDYGKFYILLDKSGSMMGLKIVWAKAVALALAQRAVRERREFFVRFFDSIPYPPIRISKRIHGRDVVKLLEYLARIRANGGTDITRAILTATDDIASTTSGNRVSDIILITDGEDRVAIDMVKRGLARANARLHTVMIHGNNPDLRAISDSYMVATKLDKYEALKVISIS
ncbi:VWA domain-containing protein [Pyrofollis japonicus]|uniref:vWA domain-containing protein n=1 Tax=Pyrofollis japonicus TaxID=3060460 RepID=UPI00295A73D8|nr:VWA domain-containing protein [Pyrofollis japonicus]BEP17648.1 VWA domain-containing protein [Pyrofollis japonicus]